MMINSRVLRAAHFAAVILLSDPASVALCVTVEKLARDLIGKVIS